jgi:hypothetical protein
MDDEKKIEVSRVVRAPADEVFALLADPKEHVSIDGSGLLRGSDSGPISGTGQMFSMTMYRDDLGEYRTFNTVTEFEPDVRLGWAPDLDPDCQLAPKLAGITIGGHFYTYRLRPDGEGTEVTQTYDWSGVGDPSFEQFCPFVTREALAATLDRIAERLEA